MHGLIVGQIVHFVDLSGEIWPGIVVKITDPEKGIASLQVFHEGYTGFCNNVPHHEEVTGEKMIPGTWHFIAVPDTWKGTESEIPVGLTKMPADETNTEKPETDANTPEKTPTETKNTDADPGPGKEEAAHE